MPKMIQIRNVPDDLHLKLKERAAANGVTLSDYLLEEVRAAAERPTLTEMMERLERLEPIKLPESAEKAVRRGRDSH